MSCGVRVQPAQAWDTGHGGRVEPAVASLANDRLLPGPLPCFTLRRPAGEAELVLQEPLLGTAPPPPPLLDNIPRSAPLRQSMEQGLVFHWLQYVLLRKVWQFQKSEHFSARVSHQDGTPCDPVSV